MTDDVKAALLLAQDALVGLKGGKCWCALALEAPVARWPNEHHSAACDDAGEALGAIRIVMELAKELESPERRRGERRQ